MRFPEDAALFQGFAQQWERPPSLSTCTRVAIRSVGHVIEPGSRRKVVDRNARFVAVVGRWSSAHVAVTPLNVVVVLARFAVGHSHRSIVQELCSDLLWLLAERDLQQLKASILLYSTQADRHRG